LKKKNITKNIIKKTKKQSEKGKKKIKEYQKKYNQMPKVKERRRNREKNNYGTQKRISQTINRQIRQCILLFIKRGFLNLMPITITKYNLLYGIDLQKIINHLKPFPKDLKNYDIDHIIPLIKFDLTKREDIKKAYSLKNLQIITKKENRKKGIKSIFFMEKNRYRNLFLHHIFLSFFLSFLIFF